MKMIARIFLAFGALDNQLRLHFSDDREDAMDVVLDLVGLSNHQELRAWCSRAISVLENLNDRNDDDFRRAVFVAERAVLRLRTSLPPPITAVKHSSRVKKPVTPVEPPSVSAKEILKYIREHPGVRTRELISNLLPTLSRRTIQRSLKYLVKSGALKRIRQKGAVLYRPTT